MPDSTIQRPPGPKIMPPLWRPAVPATAPVTAGRSGVQVTITPQGQALAAQAAYAPRGVQPPGPKPPWAAPAYQPTLYALAATALTTTLAAPAVVPPTAYLNPQDRLPPSPKPSGETAKRAADAREVPQQNFWSSLTRAVGAFFRWVASLTEADDAADHSPSEEPSTPSSPGIRIDRFV